MKSIRKSYRNRIGGSGERGSLTIFTAVMVLVLMTLMVVYTTRVSVLESKESGNDVREKAAFQAASAAINQGDTYLLSNVARIISKRAKAFPDGTGFTRDGWFAKGNKHWSICTAKDVASKSHPCGGEIPAPVGAYFYDDPKTRSANDTLPVNLAGFPEGATARLSALLCFIDSNNPGAGTCGKPPKSATEEANTTVVVTLLGYGYSDCADTASPSSCSGQSTIAVAISNFKKLSGAPLVPLVTKSPLPPTGTAEIVGNPNGGGVGVPISVWANNNNSCAPASPISSSGNWQTCQLGDWYHEDEDNDKEKGKEKSKGKGKGKDEDENGIPEGVACKGDNCQCGDGENDREHFLSWEKDGDSHIGIDIVEDENFPCDLFDTYFSVPKNLYEQVKSTATILPDCSTLGPQSNGMIWISGDRCDIGEDQVIGSPQFPVVLVSAASSTTINDGAKIFGLLYIFDGEDSAARFESDGNTTVYGSAVIDATIDSLEGTFQVVYNNSVSGSVAGIEGLGKANGGWRDFGLPEISW